MAKIDNFNHEYSSAKIKLDKVKNVDQGIESLYYKEYSISHSSEISLDEYCSYVEKIQFNKTYQKISTFFYKVSNKLVTKELIDESLKDFDNTNDIDDILFSCSSIQ